MQAQEKSEKDKQKKPEQGIRLPPALRLVPFRGKILDAMAEKAMNDGMNSGGAVLIACSGAAYLKKAGGYFISDSKKSEHYATAAERFGEAAKRFEQMGLNEMARLIRAQALEAEKMSEKSRRFHEVAEKVNREWREQNGLK